MKSTVSPTQPTLIRIIKSKMNNPYIGIAHIDYVKKDTPPYYGLHETGSGSISYNDFFK